jgi:putative oxidoreductase
MPTATTFVTPKRRTRFIDKFDRAGAAAHYLTAVGRVLFSAIFILAGLNHFSAASIGYAAQTGLPMAGLLVPLSGVLSLLGGVSILLGYHARLGAWILVLFLVPVTLLMHAFWSVDDAMMRQMQMANFMKNVALIGGALMIAHFGAGPASLDARRTHIRIR